MPHIIKVTFANQTATLLLEETRQPDEIASALIDDGFIDTTRVVSSLGTVGSHKQIILMKDGVSTIELL